MVLLVQLVLFLGVADILGIVGPLGRHCAVGTLGSVPVFAQRDSSCLPVSSYCQGISNILYYKMMLQEWIKKVSANQSSNLPDYTVEKR